MPSADGGTSSLQPWGGPGACDYPRRTPALDGWAELGPFGHPLAVIEPGTQPDGLPVALDATDIGLTGFTANWEAFDEATGYYLDMATDANFSNFVPGYRRRFVGNVTALVIAALIPGSVFFYRVRAVTADGATGTSNVIAAETTPTATEVATRVAENIAIPVDGDLVFDVYHQDVWPDTPPNYPTSGLTPFEPLTISSLQGAGEGPDLNRGFAAIPNIQRYANATITGLRVRYSHTETDGTQEGEGLFQLRALSLPRSENNQALWHDLAEAVDAYDGPLEVQTEDDELVEVALNASAIASLQDAIDNGRDSWVMGIEPIPGPGDLCSLRINDHIVFILDLEYPDQGYLNQSIERRPGARERRPGARQAPLRPLSVIGAIAIAALSSILTVMS